MKHGCNPLGRRGERNLYCSEYRNCLDKAIKQDWNFWSCGKCRFRCTRTGADQRLSISKEDILEYGLTIESPNLAWEMPESDFGGNLEIQTLY